MGRPVQPLTVNQERYIRMMARGCSRAEIYKACFNVDIATATEKEIHAAESKVTRIRKRPEYETVWKDEVRQVLIGATGDAIRVIKNQLNREDQPWLQNKAANDILVQTKQQILGEDEKQITVKVEGMPELGIPDQGE